MLKDVEDSKRANNAVSSEILRNKKTAALVRTLELSSNQLKPFFRLACPPKL
jgi:hypothetical protein